METRVAVLTAPETIEIETRPVAEPGPGEILVRVEQCGICGSDLKMYAGRHPVLEPPLIMGHEFFGTVAAMGDEARPEDGIEPRALVAIFPPVGCGRCYNCRRGHVHLCQTMTFIGGQLHGGLSELVVVPTANALAVDPRIAPELRVLIEPVAVGVHAARRAGVARDEACLIIGAGPIGAFTALALRHRGVEDIVLADLSDARLELARCLRAGRTVNSGEVALEDYLSGTVRPEGVDVAFECVGSAGTAAQALAATRKGGRAVLVGIAPRALELDGVAVQRGERSVIGVQMYERRDFGEAMEILASPEVADWPQLLRHFELDRVSDAFRALEAGATDHLKAVVTMGRSR